MCRPPGRGEKFTLVEITMFAGRSTGAKRALYKSVVRNLGALGVPALDIKITLIETPPDRQLSPLQLQLTSFCAIESRHPRPSFDANRGEITRVSPSASPRNAAATSFNKSDLPAAGGPETSTLCRSLRSCRVRRHADDHVVLGIRIPFVVLKIYETVGGVCG